MILKPRKESQNGFTIVEIIVTMVLLSLAVMTFVSMVGSVQYAQREAFYMGEASRAAQTKIEELEATPFDDISEGTINFSSDESLDNLPGDPTGQVVVSSPTDAPNSKQLDVTITYMIGTHEKKIVMTAYVDPPAA